MNKTQHKLVVVYIVLPLVVLSFSLGALVLFTDSSNSDAYSNLKLPSAFSTLDLRPVSLMTPATSGDLYSEMNSIRDDFIEFNADYGSRISINSATGASATLVRMRNYISTTERLHLAAHGVWNSVEGPKISMYNGYLTHQEVSTWSLSYGNCKLIYLSACDSMGHDGILDTDLANQLRQRTSAVSVVGFKDVANILGATLLSQSFWGFHITYSPTGGISNWLSYQNTQDRIQWKIDFIRAAGGILISTAISLIVSLGTSVVGTSFISSLLSGITTMTIFMILLDAIEDTLNRWEIIGDQVSGLAWSASGGSDDYEDVPF